MISVLQQIVVLVLAVAFAMSSAGGSMAGMRMGGYDHSAEKSLLAAHTTDGHTHIRKSEIVSVDDLDSERSAGASDHSHDGVEFFMLRDVSFRRGNAFSKLRPYLSGLGH